MILKSKFFDSKIKLSDDLILFQIRWTSFPRNSTHMQSNENKKKYLRKKMTPLCLQEEEILA